MFRGSRQIPPTKFWLGKDAMTKYLGGEAGGGRGRESLNVSCSHNFTSADDLPTNKSCFHWFVVLHRDWRAFPNFPVPTARVNTRYIVQFVSCAADFCTRFKNCGKLNKISDASLGLIHILYKWNATETRSFNLYCRIISIGITVICRLCYFSSL